MSLASDRTPPTVRRKFRNKVGLDVAIEALRDYRRRRGSVDDLLRYAEICRVARLMRPYVEVLC